MTPQHLKRQKLASQWDQEPQWQRVPQVDKTVIFYCLNSLFPLSQLYILWFVVADLGNIMEGNKIELCSSLNISKVLEGFLLAFRIQCV